MNTHLKHMMKQWLIFMLISLPVLLSAGCALNHYAQKAFYYPSQQDTGNSPKVLQLPYENLYFTSQDGTRLNAWLVPPRGKTLQEAKGTVIMVHGNAGNLTTQWAQIDWLPDQGYNVFHFDYRGYGYSAGKPSFKGLFEDTLSAINYVRQRPEIDRNKLLVIGQSLGGNNAITALAATDRRGIRAVVIDSTFYSYSRIANHYLPGIGFFVNDDYSAANHIQALTGTPLLFLHGTADKVIPYAQGQALYAIAPQPKTFISVPDGEHTRALTEDKNAPLYRQEILAFFEQALQDDHKQQPKTLTPQEPSP